MGARIDIGRLHLRYVLKEGRSVSRSQLDDVAVRLLPEALEQALGDLDDGTLVVLRRVSAQVRLRSSEGATVWARAWAESLATQVRALVKEVHAGADTAEEEVGVGFSGPVAALARYAIDAVEGNLDRWYWSPEAGALKAVQRALSSLPGVDGHTHAYASSPPPPLAPSTAQAVEWAFRTAGAALPEVIRRVASEGRLAQVLSVIRPEVAAELITGLGDRAPAPQEASTLARADSARLPVQEGTWLGAMAARLAAWPAPGAGDPRNVLALLSLAISERPSLRGAAGVTAAVERSLQERMNGRTGETGAPQAPAAPVARETGAVPSAAPRVQTPEALAPPAVAAPPPATSSEARVVPPADGEDAPEAPAELLPERREQSLPTRYGGLLFLLHLIRDLEIPSAILEEPDLAIEPGLGAVLYLMSCQLVPGAEADPVALALGGLEEPAAPATALTPERASAMMRAGARVAAEAGRFPSLVEPEDAVTLRENTAASQVARAAPPWLQELTLHFCQSLVGALRARMEVELPLAELLQAVVARTGALRQTPTHLDLDLPQDAVRLDVRRSALDVDPGWVPFLGKVVSIHYV